jgi:hypothetical protein
MGALARPMLLAQAVGPFAAASVLSGRGASMMLVLMALMVGVALCGSLRLPTRPSF